MTDYFDICGTPIKYSEIKNFRIVQREYIYRPTYIENEKSFLNRNHKFTFFKMQPYAAIVDENKKHSAVEDYKAKDFKESLGKDFVEGVVTTIGDKFHIKAISSKKYVCVNQAGRKFTTYMEDIPALLMRRDGKASDIHKNDELFPLLGEPIAPAINIINALQIIGKETYIFYGNDIQINDINAEYERLKFELNEYKREVEFKKNNRIKLSLQKIPELINSSKNSKAIPEKNLEEIPAEGCNEE